MIQQQYSYAYSQINGKSESESHSVMFNSLQPHRLYSLWNSPGWDTGVGSLSLLQGIFPTQGSNSGLPQCRWIFYQLRHKRPKNTGVGSLSLLQWILPTQELNQGLLHCRQILYQLSYQGIPVNKWKQAFKQKLIYKYWQHIELQRPKGGNSLKAHQWRSE